MVLFYSVDLPEKQWTLYMGEDKFENDQLLQYCWPNDYWFHVSDISSAHVYVRLESQESIPESVIAECCQLVKQNSIKGSKMTSVKIVYTKVKNLSKKGGMDVGQVGFKDLRQVWFVPNVSKEPEIVKKLKKTERKVPINEFIKQFEQFSEQCRAADKEKKRRDEEVKRRARDIQEKNSYSQMFEDRSAMTSNKDNVDIDEDFM